MAPQAVHDASSRDKRVQQTMELKRVVNQKETTRTSGTYSPRSSKWIARLSPVLEHYGLSGVEIHNLVKTCKYDDELIQAAVSNIVEDKRGHEHGDWATTATSTDKKARAANAKERRERREQDEAEERERVKAERLRQQQEERKKAEQHLERQRQQEERLLQQRQGGVRQGGGLRQGQGTSTAAQGSSASRAWKAPEPATTEADKEELDEWAVPESAAELATELLGQPISDWSAGAEKLDQGVVWSNSAMPLGQPASAREPQGDPQAWGAPWMDGAPWGPGMVSTVSDAPDVSLHAVSQDAVEDGQAMADADAGSAWVSEPEGHQSAIVEDAPKAVPDSSVNDDAGSTDGPTVQLPASYKIIVGSGPEPQIFFGSLPQAAAASCSKEGARPQEHSNGGEDVSKEPRVGQKWVPRGRSRRGEAASQDEAKGDGKGRGAKGSRSKGGEEADGRPRKGGGKRGGRFPSKGRGGGK